MLEKIKDHLKERQSNKINKSIKTFLLMSEVSLLKDDKIENSLLEFYNLNIDYNPSVVFSYPYIYFYLNDELKHKEIVSTGNQFSSFYFSYKSVIIINKTIYDNVGEIIVLNKPISDGGGGFFDGGTGSNNNNNNG